MSDSQRKPGLFEELKRRRVFRVATLYAVVAWLLIQIGEATFEPLGLPDGSQRLLIILTALGFPLALALGWVFDVTPEGLVRTSGDPGAKGVQLHSRRRLDLAIFGALLLVIGFLWWGPARGPELVGPSPQTDPGDDRPLGTERFRNPPLPDKPSIAVLPFDNMSDDANQEYFVDGLTEELTGKLAGVSTLFVIARNSAFTYKDQAVDIKHVGQELGVRYVLEGSAQKSAGRLRVTAQLIDATNGFHIWSKSYDRDTPDLLDLQSEIALEILGALRIEIDEAELERIRRKPTASLTAHDLTIRALEHYQNFTPEENTEARRLLEQAVKLDPSHAGALAGISRSYFTEFSAWNRDAALLELADSWNRQALSADPNNLASTSTRAILDLTRGRIRQALVSAERAIRLAPNFEYFHVTLALARQHGGDWQGALQALEYAARLNPNANITLWNVLAENYYQLGNVEQAVALWEEVRATNSAYLSPRVGLIDHYVSTGQLGRAREIAQEILRVKPDFDAEMARRPGRITLEHEPDQKLLDNLRTAGLLGGTAEKEPGEGPPSPAEAKLSE